MFGLDPLDFVWLAPGLVLALWAQWRMRRSTARGRQLRLRVASQAPRQQPKSYNLPA